MVPFVDPYYKNFDFFYTFLQLTFIPALFFYNFIIELVSLVEVIKPLVGTEVYQIYWKLSRTHSYTSCLVLRAPQYIAEVHNNALLFSLSAKLVVKGGNMWIQGLLIYVYAVAYWFSWSYRVGYQSGLKRWLGLWHFIHCVIYFKKCIDSYYIV